MRYIDYIDDYLPGTVYRRGLKEYTPQQRLDYRISKKFKFKPDSKKSSIKSFEEILNMAKNPTAMMQSQLNKLPSGFLASSYG